MTEHGHAPHPVDPDALQRWINDDLGIEGFRRLVRDDGEQILVSKFDEGFAAGVHELIALMPELFELPSVVGAYEAAAGDGGARLDAWHRGMHAMLREAGAREGISDLRQAEVRTGIDSVYAVLSTALWSDPQVDQLYTPGPGERTAYLDALASLEDGRDIFTRVYGRFEGRLVVNHCPGASFARVMLAQGWTACTGEPPPDAAS
ncbi:MAG: hypothetical protein O3A10_02860 [Chloroflexi bacterium]|nr:hypothetical protein [Chloroflexota bacterium]MDA1145154.1 hypothetical protein [Chloroflexota bacterium]